ncbi:thiamine pyrophosphate-dependent enzyme [Aliivibrio fischeri]|uniref:thiamine pyrophosphate-dependent enzyme n=1 Tax=Aliivibrio fischeri TaxID=668 RepID=UPI0012D9883C|nr:thiamine pyrophosphate-dependent enzyme [Aliivibrio fischeri]MUJ19207.1 sulfopyruvate decarboxylase subunit beta [Aliivibrio fischeri]MUL17046.1 sulfopyruvate decarboxylase subunit beta [Aliivibrio fischeri]
MISSYDGLKEIIKYCNNHPVIFTTGYTCRSAFNINDKDNHFYMLGSMGMASSIGAGIAMCSNHKVIIVDGDGSFLMNPSAQYTISSMKLSNIVHIVFDNSSYESTGGQDTCSNYFDLCKISISAGYKKAVIVNALTLFTEEMKRSLESNNGPILILCKTKNKTKNEIGRRVDISPELICKRFSKFCQK